jgi:hypothetical protein
MKTFLLITCIFGALMMASGAPSPAGDLSRTGEYKLSQGDACHTSCRANADACRTQCADPEEQEQCIVNCGKSVCNSDCDKFERACNQHCQSSKAD